MLFDQTGPASEQAEELAYGPRTSWRREAEATSPSSIREAKAIKANRRRYGLTEAVLLLHCITSLAKGLLARVKRRAFHCLRIRGGVLERSWCPSLCVPHAALVNRDRRCSNIVSINPDPPSYASRWGILFALSVCVFIGFIVLESGINYPFFPCRLSSALVQHQQHRTDASIRGPPV